jgi:hypothetical protein
MTEWIRCNNCSFRFKAFMSSCPSCKALVIDKSQMSKKHSKIYLPVNSSKKRSVIIFSYIFVSLIITSTLVTVFVFHFPSTNTHVSVETLKQHALKKINEDRANFNLPPVQLSSNYAAQAHADELSKTETLSHWTLDGMKPYMRYSMYDGNDNVVQNVAQEKYGIVSDTIWNMGKATNNNDNENSATSDIGGQIQIFLCKLGIPSCPNTIDDPFKAIDDLEYKMVYDDLICCDNGHRFNILDGNHTHVSLGIAYNKFYIGLVQNFENKDTVWSEPITFNNVTKMVSFSGQIKEPNIDYSGIVVSYDPVPSKNTYDDNHDRKSYDGGKEIAWIVNKTPEYFNDDEINMQYDSDMELVTADKWNIYNLNSNSFFDVSFSLKNLMKKYGDGVYTINIFYNDHGKIFQATSKSLFTK